MVGPDKCQRRGRLGRRNPHSDSEEQPKCAPLLPQRGQSCLRLTRQGSRHRFSGEGEAQNGNSGFYTLQEAKVLIEQWRRHYNRIRPHSALGYRPPAPETGNPAAGREAAASRPRHRITAELTYELVQSLEAGHQDYSRIRGFPVCLSAHGRPLGSGLQARGVPLWLSFSLQSGCAD